MTERTHILPKLALLFVVLLLSTTWAQAQKVNIQGGVVLLTIGGATPGQDLAPATDSGSKLDWTAPNSGMSKITVETYCIDEKYDLFLSATLTKGTATIMPEVQLTSNMLPTDFARDIPPKNVSKKGRATLTYRAVASVAQSSGSDAHLITFTIVAQ